MLKVEKYESSMKSLWDHFISKSKNGTFLFYRDYMEYHSDRFQDHSLLFFDNEKTIAVMPANVKGNTLISHEGLTFGGIITDHRMRTHLMLRVFTALKEYLKARSLKRVIYKVIPHIYHDILAEEDLYALFIHNGKLIRRDVSSTIFAQKRVGYSKGRKWAIKKSNAAGLEIKRSYDFKRFMAIEEAHLKAKYGVKPVHTADEMELLASRFPEYIKLFATFEDDTMLAGAVIYESDNVAHAQYLGMTDHGKEIGAQDIIIDYLINDYFSSKNYFDFGIATEDEGRYLNEGLVQYKESFGEEH